MSSRPRSRAVACLLSLGVLWSVIAGVPSTSAEGRKTLLLLPVASGTPGQEMTAKALGGILESAFGSLPAARLVTGAAREVVLRELSASATVTPEAFRDICLRAGADLAVLGGSTLSEGRLALEIRIFDVGAARELLAYFGEEPAARAYDLAGAAVRHVAEQAALGPAENLFPLGVTTSLEAYAAYREALLEEDPAARIGRLRKALELDADYADPTRRLGVELFRQGSLDEALGVLERAVALGPKVAEARNNFGVALAAAGRPEQAQREFEEAVALAPDYAEARVNLARVFEDRGRLSEAEQQYTAVVEADAGNDKARAGRASLYDRTGRPELAIKEYRLLSARRPDLAEGEFILTGQEARKAREYARAEKFFLRATEINPQFSQAWAELGTNSYLAGQYAKGVEYFRRALTIDPGQAQYHYYLGLALDKGRQQDEALREYRRAVELGGPPEARLGLARAALESGDPGLAVEELNRLLVASPDHAEAKVLLAQATGEMEARRRLVEGQSQFANQRLARLEQIVADVNRSNRELEARLLAVNRDKRALEEQIQRERGAGPGTADPGPAVTAPEGRPRLAGAPPPQAADGNSVPGGAAGEPASPGEGGRVLERSQGEKDIAEERERLNRDLERLRAELAASEAARTALAAQMTEAAETKGRLLAAQGVAAKAEEAQRAERERGERALALEREERRAEVEKLRSELAAGQHSREENTRLLQDLAAEREESRRQSALLAERLAALEEQLKTQAQLLQTREAELVSAHGREGSISAQNAKSQADLALLAERHAALEARAAAESRTLAERERALEKAVLTVRELALELGRIALRTQSWEKARGYLEQAAEADPRSGEAWYGLGEVFFQLGQYEKSKLMYDKAKQIY